MSFEYLKNLWRKVLVWLRVRIPTGGIEVSDSVIRWCRMVDGKTNFVSVKLAPGICMDGIIVDRPAFLSALRELRVAGFGRKEAGAGNILVVVTMSSLPTFMRLFELPWVEGDRLEAAVALNLKMITPETGAPTAAGWRLIESDHDRGRVLVAAAFADRQAVDDVVAALRDVGFIAVAMEPKSVSLARAIVKNGAGIDMTAAYIVIFCDDAGIDFLIVRRGVLGFSYAIPWRDLMDAQGAVAGEAFALALVRGVRQITNFYQRHWSEAPRAVLVSAGDFFESVRASIVGEISQPIMPLELTNPQDDTAGVSAASGATLRGADTNQNDRDMTLLGGDAGEIYEQEKIRYFFKFWQIALPSSFAVVIGLLLLGDFMWLRGIETNMALSAISVPTTAPAQLATLTASAATFNRSVNFIAGIEASEQDRATLFSKIGTVASSAAVTLTRITDPGSGFPLTITGSASSEDAIVAFKSALAASGIVSSVSLPISAIQPTSNGYSFTMTVQN